MGTKIKEPPALNRTLQEQNNILRDIHNVLAEGAGSVVYGFRISATESDPASKVKYLKDAINMEPAHMDFSNSKFDYGSWADAFFMPRPCMLKSDGTVDYYLDPNDYTKKSDGTASDVANTSYDGNAMMEWGQNGKKIWIKYAPSGDTLGCDVFISDHKVDEDYHDWSFHNSAGASVDHFYTPIYNGSLDTNNKLRSLSGQAVMKTKTAAQEREYAQNNNPTGKKMYDIECKADIDLIDSLLVLMAKTTDTQTAYGQGLHTGGSDAINDGFRTGVHNDKGLFYGTNSGSISSSSYVNAVKVFGMENWWGFQWRRYIGHIMVNGVQKVKLTYGMEDGSTVEGYNLTGAGYKTANSTAPSGTNGGYIDTMKFTEDGMFPRTASGTSTTHYCDGLWFNNGITSVPLRGGSSHYGALVGAFCVNLHYVAGIAHWDFGAALSCKPLAA